MATFLAVPLKQTQEAELIKPMRSFIQNTFSQADPDDYNKALNEFSKLRNLMIAKSVDKHDSALEILYRYYDQVVAIENKLPIAENQIRVNFKWRDAFDKESLFSGKRILAIASGSYEKVCMLFNIAALQTQIAEVQNHDSDEGLKTSAKYFQSASGIFGHLKDVVLSHIQQDPTPDMNPDTLNALCALMVAQAQETIYRKCASDKMKDAMVAKVVHQCSDLYADAMKLMQLSTLKDLWPKDWLPSVVMKQAAFHAMAEFYQSCVCKDARSYGEQIARLQHANDLMAASSQRGGTTFNFKNEQGKIQRELQAAKKDNDFIYHDKVPDVKTLDTIGKATIAKPSPPPSGTFSDKFQDLFSKLVPIPVYEALNAFENRKNQVISGEIGRLRESTTLMNSVLASLNLPAALEDVSGSNKVPQSVLDKARQVQEQGGMQQLDKLINDLPELLSRNREILDDCIKQLDDEEQSDKQLREQFKERWSRTPSDKLTKPMRDECMKYKHILDTAIGADKIVQQKYSTHKSAISLLSKPSGELEKGLPSAGSSGGLQNNSAVQQLKKMMEEIETIKVEREVVETQIKDATFDMSSKFFSAMASDGLIDEESISVGELDRTYSPLREQVNDSIQRQEMLMARIQNSNTEFCQAKASNQGAAQREQVLKDLTAGFDIYIELKSNLEEGTKFYHDLTPLLVQLQNKISDFCFARKTEKDELMADFQKKIASQPTGPPPNAPSYQSPPDKMATSSDVLCSICEARHTMKNADNWCPECEEGLCLECLEHHNVSKYTKSHEVISIENYHKIPQSVSKIVQHCTEHDRQHQNYCPMHESLCCPLCISEDHNDCVGLLAIENIVKTAKTSAMLDSIEDTLKDISSNMERVMRDREENLTKITDQRRKIHNEIQEERRKINEHLDKLEEQVIGNLDAEEAKIKSEIENLLENLNKKAVTIEMLQSKLSAVKLYASDLQTFLGGRTILREVEEEEMYVTTLLEDKCLQQINLCYRPEEKMAAINNIEIFGSVCRETNPPAINIKRGKDKQAQIMTFTTPVRNVSIHDINLARLRKKKHLCIQITGCTITPSGKFIFTDYYTSGLHILNEDWTSDNLDTKLPAIRDAYDVTCIDDTRLAISTGRHHQIIILNIASKKIERIINTSHGCYGITQNEGSLMFCKRTRGISRVQLPGNSISLLVKQRGFPSNTYVITSGDNIYHTNYKSDTVSCHKINGDKLWEFKDVAIISEPRGVAVDKDLNVYVASEDNDSVVVISPDGKRCRTVLGVSDGIYQPSAIYFDKVKNNLVVCNFKGTAFLYKVE